MRALLGLSVAMIALTGCGRTVMPGCEATATPIADDAVTDLGFSTAEIFASVADALVFPGQYEDGTPVGLTVTVARADGPAALVRSVQTSTSSPNGQMIGTSYPSILVICRDSVQAPVRVGITSDDGATAIDVVGTAIAADPDELVTRVETAPGELDGLPPEAADGPEGIVDHGFVETTIHPGADSRGAAGYSGTTTSDSGESYWWRPLVSWDTTEPSPP